MEQFLSGYSHNYAAGSQQIGQQYTGNVSSAGAAGTSQSASGVDITQLQPGDSFQGEIASVNGEDVQIQLANGQYMAAKLERDVQVAIGQVLNLQVQSNKDNRIVLKPIYDNNMQMLRVGESALRAANLAVNAKNLQLVSTLIENGMSIDKNTLMTFNRLALQHPQVDLETVIKLSKMQLPVTDSNLAQYQNYQNMEHRLLDGIKNVSEEILKLYDSLAGTNTAGGNVSAAPMLGQAGTYMEQILGFLTGEETSVPPNAQTTQGILQQGGITLGNENNTVQNGVIQNDTQPNGTVLTDIVSNLTTQEEEAVKELQQTGNNNIQEGAADSIKLSNGLLNQEASADTATMLRDLEGHLQTTKPQDLPDKVISLIKDGTLDLKEVKLLLSDFSLLQNMPPELKDKIFRSEPFRSMVRKGLQRQWMLSPQEIATEGKVEEFYQKLARQSNRLSQLMNEAANAQQGANEASMKSLNNFRENLDFMNQMNQMFHYVQLPLKLNNSQAHGDLYVYTNKKNLARKDGMLTAFLHLDMENLGGMDISISLQTERNQVMTKFYLEEHALPVIAGHIDDLTQRLAKKGYQCTHTIQKRESEKTVMQHMEEQIAGGNITLSYQTFDTRA